MTKQAMCQAFCSTANLGAGFDVFGLALKKYSDKVRIRITQGRKIRIFVKGNISRAIPNEVSRNSAGPPATALVRKAGVKHGLEITIEKNVPQGLGLGSSGASAAACTKCIDHLLELHLSENELVRIASLGERAVSGTAHPDNVAASLLGGFIIVYDSPVRTVSLPPPRNLGIVVVTPNLPVLEHKTRTARKLVPKRLDTRKAILNIGRASATAVGFATGDIDIIGSGMNDNVAEPYRERMIPNYRRVKNAAIRAKAAGVSISGAGPSVISLVDRTRCNPVDVAKAMASEFRRASIQSKWFITEPAPAARILGK